MLETTKPGSSIPVETCVFANRKFSAYLDFSRFAYFCRLCSAEFTFLVKFGFFLAFRKLFVKCLKMQPVLFWIFCCSFFSAKTVFLFFFLHFFRLISIIVIHICIASCAKLSFVFVLIFFG